MNRNWKTNLGGALQLVGKSLLGIGLFPQLAGDHANLFFYTAFVGFVLEAIGQGITALFSADSSQVANLAARVNDSATPKA